MFTQIIAAPFFNQVNDSLGFFDQLRTSQTGKTPVGMRISEGFIVGNRSLYL